MKITLSLYCPTNALRRSPGTFAALLALPLFALALNGCSGGGSIPSDSDLDKSKRVILFRSGDAADGGLYTIKSDGSDRKKVVDGAQQPGAGRLSRDRNFIATALGTATARLAIGFTTGSAPTNFPDSSQYADADFPAFSPNTASMVFVGDNDLFTIGTDQKNLKKLTSLTTGVPNTKIPPTATRPAYLDDNSGILYAKTEAVDKPAAGQPEPVIPIDIYRIAIDGTTEVRLTDTKNNTAPRSRPDGAKIVFASTRDNNPNGHHEIYSMNADGTGATRLTTNDADDTTPVCGPDSKLIAFLSDREKAGEYKIYIMNDDGSDVRKVSDALAAPDSLDWR